MFRDAFKPESCEAGVQPADNIIIDSETRATIKLKANCFKIGLNPSCSLHHYHYAVSDATITPEEERKCLESAWSDFESKFGKQKFCVRAPGHIFSPSKVEDFEVKLSGIERENDKSEQDLTMKVTWYEEITDRDINSGAGPPEKRSFLGLQRVGMLMQAFFNFSVKRFS